MISGPDERPTVRRLDGGSFAETLGPGPVCDVAETPGGTLWGSGCEVGVFVWNGTSWVPGPSAGAAPLGGGDIAIDGDGRVWLAEASGGRCDGAALSDQALERQRQNLLWSQATGACRQPEPDHPAWRRHPDAFLQDLDP